MYKDGRYRFSIALLIVLGDVVFLNLLYYGLRYAMDLTSIGNATTIREIWMGMGRSQIYTAMQVWINCGYLIAVAVSRVEVDIRRMALRSIIRINLYRCVVIAVVTVAGLFITKTSAEVSRLFLTTYFPLLFLLLVTLRVFTKKLMDGVSSSSWYSETAIILGAGVMGKKVYEEILSNRYLGVNVLGFFDDDPDKQGGLTLGTTAEAMDFLKKQKVNRIYCTLPLEARDTIATLLDFAETQIVQFYIIPAVRQYTEMPLVLKSVGNIPVLSIREVPLSYFHKAIVKRTFDFLVAAIFLLTLFPIIYIIVGLAIKLSSPGPVFFKQERTGRGGKTFTCYKFRSMRISSDAHTRQATANDVRKTRVGNFIRRTNLDELPQFINVLNGDMSIVGPRPHMLLHTSEYSKLVDKYMVRHLIRPGITGLAQISGFRGETKTVEQMEGRVRKDIWYIENWSPYLDLEIILRTVMLTFKGDKKAY